MDGGWHRFRRYNPPEQHAAPPRPWAGVCVFSCRPTCGRRSRPSTERRPAVRTWRKNRPMQQRRNRLSLAVLTAVLFVAVSLESTPSVPAPTSPYQYPPRDEKAITQDLTHFLASGAGLGNGSFHAFRSSDLPILRVPGVPGGKPRRPPSHAGSRCSIPAPIWKRNAGSCAGCPTARRSPWPPSGTASIPCSWPPSSRWSRASPRAPSRPREPWG